jgi:hypothetical protein
VLVIQGAILHKADVLIVREVVLPVTIVTALIVIGVTRLVRRVTVVVVMLTVINASQVSVVQ